MQERFNWHAWKACVGAISPGVRISSSPPELQSAILEIMRHFIKNSALVIIAVYALFAAIVGILYVMGSITQAVVTDWLVKGLYVALIFMALTVVIGFITQRGK